MVIKFIVRSHSTIFSHSEVICVESRAISGCLEHNYKDKGVELIPKQHRSKLPMPVVTFWEKPSKSNEIFSNQMLKYTFMDSRMKGQGHADEEQVASLKKQLNTNFDVYEKILSQQPYLGGDL